MTKFSSFNLQFPFFCSDREYIIGKRIWEAGKTYYCITKVWLETFDNSCPAVASFPCFSSKMTWLLIIDADNEY